MEDHNRSFWNVVESICATREGGEGEGAGSSGPRPAACSDYLESVGKDCGTEPTSEVLSEEYEVRCCGCRIWFCPHCCTGRGLALRERLIPILQTFSGLLMWTFTVDPKLFASPAAAFKYVREKRCISETMRGLRRLGFLHSGRYFYVVEWQRDTQMAHFHLLCDASFIPFDLVCSLWNRFRPTWAGPAEGSRPGFGSVRFSAPKFADARHAANYACAYLIKHPDQGYPEWIETSTDQVHRYSTSRGFWGTSKVETPSKLDDMAEAEHAASDADCCPACGHEAEGSTDHCESCGWSVLAEPVETPRLTIRERLAKCGEKSVLLKVRTFVDLSTGEQKMQRDFVALFEVSIKKVADALGHRNDPNSRSLSLRRESVPKLLKEFCSHSPAY